MADKAGDVSIDYIVKHCSAFKSGCPYNDARLKQMVAKCPIFQDDDGNFVCAFKERARDTYELRSLLMEMKDKCPAKKLHDEFFKALMQINKDKAAKIGHCPYFKGGCKLNNTPIFYQSVAK